MKSTFSISFYLRGNRLNKIGEAPIMISVTNNKNREQFNSKLSVRPSLWDNKSGRARGKTTEASNLNRLLDNIRSRISTIHTEHINTYGYTTAEKVKNTFLGIGNESKMLVEHFFERYLEHYKTKVGNTTSEKTYGRYVLTKARIADFLKLKYNITDIHIREMTTVIIEEFFFYLRNEVGLSHNSAQKFVQRLRTVFYYVRNSGENIADPFANFRIKMEKEEVGYLEQNELDIICRKDFEIKRLEQVRDIFIFCCYTGLSYIDVEKLTKVEMIIGIDEKLWINTKREKTNERVSIPLLDIPMQILEKYKFHDKKNDEKLLPVLSNQKTNAYLKEIADVCGINKKLTFHMRRHRIFYFYLKNSKLQEYFS